jgi:hypothetical protein
LDINKNLRNFKFRPISILILALTTPILAITTASILDFKPEITRNQILSQFIWSDPDTPISATLLIDHLPAPGEPAKVDCIVSSQLDAPGTQVEIELPADAKLLEGDLSWEGDILKGDSITVTATIAFNGIGNKVEPTAWWMPTMYGATWQSTI